MKSLQQQQREEKTAGLFGEGAILLKIAGSLFLFGLLLWTGGLFYDSDPGTLLSREGALTVLIVFFVFLGKQEKTVSEKLERLLYLDLSAALVFLPQRFLTGFAGTLKTGGILLIPRLMALCAALVFSVLLFQKKPVSLLFDSVDRLFFKTDAACGKRKPGDVVLCEKRPEDGGGEEILPLKDRFLHMLILGPTGCGKTSRLLIPMIRQDAANSACGITVIEPKGDLAVKAYMLAKDAGRKKTVYFDPSLKNCPKFNPLSGKEADVVENMSVAFKMLKPDTPQYYLDLEDNLLRDAVKVLKRMDHYTRCDGKYATMINLDRFLFDKEHYGSSLIRKLRERLRMERVDDPELSDILAWFEKEYFSRKGKIYDNTGGIRSQVSKLNSNCYVRRVLNPDYDRGEKNEIRFDTHLEEGSVLCISTAQGFLRDLSSYLGYFLILNLQSAVFRRGGTEESRSPHFLYIDEFQTYSTPAFSDMLTQGRSYRVGSILATQARAQMAMGGGSDGKNFVEVVSSNARNVVLFPGISGADARYYSEQFGEYEKEEEVVSKSRRTFNPLAGGLTLPGHPSESVRTEKRMTRHFTPTDLIYGTDPGNGFGEIIYTLVQNNSLQMAKSGRVHFIPEALNLRIDRQISAYRTKHAFLETEDVIRDLTKSDPQEANPEPFDQKEEPERKPMTEEDYF